MSRNSSNSKAVQHQRPRNSGRGAGRVFASDEAAATHERDRTRRERQKFAKAKQARDAKLAALIAELPQLALEPRQLYQAERARAIEQGKPVLRTRAELQAPQQQQAGERE